MIQADIRIIEQDRAISFQVTVTRFYGPHGEKNEAEMEEDDRAIRNLHELMKIGVVSHRSEKTLPTGNWPSEDVFTFEVRPRL